MIEQYVPERYWAKPEGPIREFLMVKQSALADLTSKLIRSEVVGPVQGLSIDMCELMRKPGKDHFVIMVSDDILLEDHMIFILLHEVGHVDWHFSEDSKNFSEEEHELYADFFAFETLKDVMGMDRAFDILLRYCSAQGMGKEILKHHDE